MNKKNATPSSFQEASSSSSPLPTLALPHPAEDLSADDDLLSWILVDQLGALPDTRLGVHPQQVKFVGPVFKTQEVMDIIRETVIVGNINEAIIRLSEWNLIAAHLQSKSTKSQQDRFLQHLRRYLLPLLPSSRVEVFTTPRYTAVTKHTELAVFATCPLVKNVVLQELQGSLVPLPESWREEMEIGEDYALRAAEEDEDYSGSESDSSDQEEEEDGQGKGKGKATEMEAETVKTKGKGKERESEKSRGARRSDRTKRRDFSIVYSAKDRCVQLFLGPARFLNHDCVPNVELLRQGRHYMTFRVIRDIRIGDELTTTYGDDYFGKNNVECLCLTCEQRGTGGFTPTEPTSRALSASRSRSRDVSAAPPPSASSAKFPPRPSQLRKVLQDDEDDASSVGRDSSAGPSDSKGEMDSISTPQKKSKGSHDDETNETNGSDSEAEHESPVRERSRRLAAQKIKPWAYLKRPKEILKAMQMGTREDAEEDEDLPEDFPRCGTCAKALHERVWYANRYFDHCARCVRHALIFNLPWPAHRPQDIAEYPPSHVVPMGYMPKRISTIPLPSLSKKKPEAIPAPLPSLPPLTKDEKAQVNLRALFDMQDFIEETNRLAAWSAQRAEEQAIQDRLDAMEAAAKRREEHRLRKAEEKRKRDENTVKGSGVWSRYAYVTDEEWEAQIAAKNAVTSGTRRGGRFRRADDDEEMQKLAEEKQKKELEKQRKKDERERARERRDRQRAREAKGAEEDDEDEDEIEDPDDDEEDVVEAVTRDFPGDASVTSSSHKDDDSAAEVRQLLEGTSIPSSRSRSPVPGPSALASSSRPSGHPISSVPPVASAGKPVKEATKRKRASMKDKNGQTVASREAQTVKTVRPTGQVANAVAGPSKISPSKPSKPLTPSTDSSTTRPTQPIAKESNKSALQSTASTSSKLADASKVASSTLSLTNAGPTIGVGKTTTIGPSKSALAAGLSNDDALPPPKKKRAPRMSKSALPSSSTPDKPVGLASKINTPLGQSLAGIALTSEQTSISAEPNGKAESSVNGLGRTAAPSANPLTSSSSKVVHPPRPNVAASTSVSLAAALMADRYTAIPAPTSSFKPALQSNSPTVQSAGSVKRAAPTIPVARSPAHALFLPSAIKKVDRPNAEASSSRTVPSLSPVKSLLPTAESSRSDRSSGTPDGAGRGRGRPPGTGKHQIKRAQEEAARSIAASSTSPIPVVPNISPRKSSLSPSKLSYTTNRNNETIEVYDLTQDDEEEEAEARALRRQQRKEASLVEDGFQITGENKHSKQTLGGGEVRLPASKGCSTSSRSASPSKPGEVGPMSGGGSTLYGAEDEVRLPRLSIGSDRKGKGNSSVDDISDELNNEPSCGSSAGSGMGSSPGRLGQKTAAHPTVIRQSLPGFEKQSMGGSPVKVPLPLGSTKSSPFVTTAPLPVREEAGPLKRKRISEEHLASNKKRVMANYPLPKIAPRPDPLKPSVPALSSYPDSTQ